VPNETLINKMIFTVGAGAVKSTCIENGITRLKVLHFRTNGLNDTHGIKTQNHPSTLFRLLSLTYFCVYRINRHSVNLNQKIMARGTGSR
jgi:hypothetical protein